MSLLWPLRGGTGRRLREWRRNLLRFYSLHRQRRGDAPARLVRRGLHRHGGEAASLVSPWTQTPSPRPVSLPPPVGRLRPTMPLPWAPPSFPPPPPDPCPLEPLRTCRQEHRMVQLWPPASPDPQLRRMRPDPTLSGLRRHHRHLGRPQPRSTRAGWPGQRQPSTVPPPSGRQTGPRCSTKRQVNTTATAPSAKKLKERGFITYLEATIW